MTAHWHILGAGSIGLLWAAELSKAGHTVTLIRHKQETYPQHIRYNDDLIALEVLHNSQVKRIDNLLITTKTWQTLDAIAAIQTALHSNTQIVLLQNGMANQARLSELFPHNPVYAAITTDGALREQAWQIKRTGIGRTIYGALTAKASGLRPDLACDLQLEKSESIQMALWQKLAMNCCINPLTAIYNCLNGELLQNAQALEQTQQILIECMLVGEKLGFAQALASIEEQVYAVMQSTANNSSSMREDVLNARPTEIDAINGYIVEQGQRLGIATPVNLKILNHIKGI